MSISGQLNPRNAIRTESALGITELCGNELGITPQSLNSGIVLHGILAVKELTIGGKYETTFDINLSHCLCERLLGWSYQVNYTLWNKNTPVLSFDASSAFRFSIDEITRIHNPEYRPPQVHFDQKRNLISLRDMNA